MRGGVRVSTRPWICYPSAFFFPLSDTQLCSQRAVQLTQPLYALMTAERKNVATRRCERGKCVVSPDAVDLERNLEKENKALEAELKLADGIVDEAEDEEESAQERLRRREARQREELPSLMNALTPGSKNDKGHPHTMTQKVRLVSC